MIRSPTGIYKVILSVWTLLFLCTYEHHILPDSMPKLSIVFSSQMSCVQRWRSNLIAFSPTAPVMVLKRFQVCENCCFPNGNTQCWQYLPVNHKVNASSFKAFPTHPHLAFLFLYKERHFILPRFRQLSKFPSIPIWLESKLVLFMTLKVLLLWHYLTLPSYKHNIFVFAQTKYFCKSFRKCLCFRDVCILFNVQGSS